MQKNERERIEITLTYVFNIKEYNFLELKEIREKARKIIEVILIGEISEKTVDYLNSYCFDKEAIEKTIEILKRHKQYGIGSKELEEMKQKIIKLKSEYKNKKKKS